MNVSPVLQQICGAAILVGPVLSAKNSVFDAKNTLNRALRRCTTRLVAVSVLYPLSHPHFSNIPASSP
eukprot:3998199-Pleurochrysis_carterae.AAC.4